MPKRVMSRLMPSAAPWGSIVLSALLLLALALSLTSCADSTSTSATKPSGPIKAKWIDSNVDGDNVSIPVSEVENNWNIHFKVDIPGGNMTFMAYELDGEIHVRANVCPPCRSIGYTLDGDELVCDRCATTFKALTGDGIKGACVDYPKASVPFEITGGNIVMSEADLTAAYEDTLERGWP